MIRLIDRNMFDQSRILSLYVDNMFIANLTLTSEQVSHISKVRDRYHWIDVELQGPVYPPFDEKGLFRGVYSNGEYCYSCDLDFLIGHAQAMELNNRFTEFDTVVARIEVQIGGEWHDLQPLFDSMKKNQDDSESPGWEKTVCPKCKKLAVFAPSSGDMHCDRCGFFNPYEDDAELADIQVTIEEGIASIIFEMGESVLDDDGVDEEVCAHLGRIILNYLAQELSTEDFTNLKNVLVQEGGENIETNKSTNSE